MSYSLSRSRGMLFEPLAERHLSNRLGFIRVTGPEHCSPAAQVLLGTLAKHPTISCGRNSAVEGVWMDPHGEPVIVEATGSPDESRLPGLVRSDNGRKMLGSASAIALVCHQELTPPPGFVIVTTALPEPGTSAAGWVSGLLMLVSQGWLASLEVYLLDRSGRPVADFDDTMLSRYFERPWRRRRRTVVQGTHVDPVQTAAARPDAA